MSMTKKLFFLISIFTTLGAFAAPFSLSNFYIDGFVGVNFLNRLENENTSMELSPGYAIGGSVGYKLFSFLRIEGESSYRSNELRRIVFKPNGYESIEWPAYGNAITNTTMANGIIQLPMVGNVLAPYFGAGIGYRSDSEQFGVEPVHTRDGTFFFEPFAEKNHGSAYQGIAGLTLFASKKIEAGMAYRYLDGSDMLGNHTACLNLKGYF